MRWGYFFQEKKNQNAVVTSPLLSPPVRPTLLLIRDPLAQSTEECRSVWMAIEGVI